MTGVQTCALPICQSVRKAQPAKLSAEPALVRQRDQILDWLHSCEISGARVSIIPGTGSDRSSKFRRHRAEPNIGKMRNQDNPPQKNRFDRSGPYPRAALLSDVRSSARTPANMECCHLARLLQSPPIDRKSTRLNSSH